MGVVNYYGVDGEISGDSQAGDYMRDALGSVTGTISPTNAAAQNTYRYKPYGSELSSSGASPTPRFQWVGSVGYKQTAVSHSATYVRARHYGEGEGRWATVDPIWPWEQSYSYVAASPVGYFDNQGLSQSSGLSIGKAVGRLCMHPCLADPCKWAVENQPKGRPLEDSLIFAAGYVICCDGRPYICFGPGQQQARKGIQDCVRVHERYHAGQGRCATSPDGEDSGPPLEECGAYSAEIRCLLANKFRDCNKLSGQARLNCLEEYNDAVRDACTQARDTYKCGPGQLPAICF